MAIGTDVLFTDSFDRADGAVGADWEFLGVSGVAFAISGNVLTHTAGLGAGPKVALAVGGVNNSDPNYKVSFKTDNVVVGAVLLRASSVGGLTGYAVGRDSSANYYFGRYNAGVLTVLESAWIGSAWLNGTLTAEIETIDGSVVLRLKSTNNGTVKTFTDSSASKILDDGYYGLVATKTTAGSWFDSFTIWGVAEVTASVLTSATPSGTLTSSVAATIGATSTLAVGDLHIVLATTDIFAGVTGPQIVAGQNAAGNTTGVLVSDSEAVTDLTPSIDITSLTPGTTYYYAEVQVVSGTNSNVLTGSFTTAAINKGVRIADIYAPNSAALVANATGVTAVVYDVCGGTEMYQGTLAITAGTAVIDSEAIGAVGATPFVLLRWVVGADELTYAATETVIDVGA